MKYFTGLVLFALLAASGASVIGWIFHMKVSFLGYFLAFAVAYWLVDVVKHVRRS